MARGLAVAVVALIVCLPASAHAAEIQLAADCGTLQARFDEIESAPLSNGNSYVVTLNSSAGPGGLCAQAYTAPDLPTPAGIENYRVWTLQGRPGMNDGFDGTGIGRILTAHDPHRMQVQELIFRDGSVTAPGADGGAISVTGEASLSVFTSRFFANQADDRGGAISFAPTFAPAAALNGMSLYQNTFGSTTDAALGNQARTGGAVSMESAGGANVSYTDNLFGKNVATDDGGALAYSAASATDNVSVDESDIIGNRAGGSGGALHLAGPGTLQLRTNLYQGNRVGSVTGTEPASDHFGGAVHVEDPGSFVQLYRNRFEANAVEAFGNGQSYGGGALAIIGNDITNSMSSFDRFQGNSVAGQPALSAHESEGGALFFSGANSKWYSFVGTYAGNSVGANGEGGAIYVGAVVGFTTLELAETTVAGNSVGAGGAFAGLAGDADDALTMRNSIVYNSQQPDIGGFDPALLTVAYTDACRNGAAFVGTGNVCTDPLLANPPAGDIHQTKQSPTIDAGGEHFVEGEGGGERELTDFEGDPRSTDGNGDGHTVDMGADETPAGFAVQQPPPPPPAPQCSDQVDNDGDGAVDAADPGCLAGPADDNEGDETPGDLVLCGQRTISLVRADVSGARVVLSGFVATSLAGQKVQLSVRYLGGGAKPARLGSITAGADGRFQGRVKKPPKRLFNAARYRAQVGNAKSVELKLPQSLASSSLKRVGGGQLELRGQVQRSLLGKRNAVVVKRILCGRYTTVGQAKPNRRGAYVVRFPAPATGGSALYRAETRVLARPGSKRYVKQFARAIGITF